MIPQRPRASCLTTTTLAAGAWLAWGLLGAPSGCGGRDEPAASAVPEAPGYCAKACVTSADCCPDGSTDCPGDYPYNYACEGGLCRAPHCQSDDDCAWLSMDGGVASVLCGSLGGYVGCLRGCTTDADCAQVGGLAAGTCTGLADDGTPTCAADLGSSSLGCTTDADCPAERHCQSGTCGCATDAECAPSLDVCTKDRAFAYPASAGSTGG